MDRFDVLSLDELKVAYPFKSKIPSIQFERKEVEQGINELTNVDHNILNTFIYDPTKLIAWIEAFRSLIMSELDSEIEPEGFKLEVQFEHLQYGLSKEIDELNTEWE